jgi:hypothetical protein
MRGRDMDGKFDEKRKKEKKKNEVAVEQCTERSIGPTVKHSQ